MNPSDYIKDNEGLILKPYKDVVDVWTIGYGHNLEEGISKTTADFIFDEDLSAAESNVNEIFGESEHLIPVLDGLSYDRWVALVDMMFNLGKTRFSKFKKMIAAIKIGDWEIAARECLDSKYAIQVPERAKRNANLLLTGKFKK